MMNEKIGFYTLDKILTYGADYNIIYGERSNGKTTSVIKMGFEEYCNSGYQKQIAIIRRWGEDFKGKNGEAFYSTFVTEKWIEKYTRGEYNGYTYKSLKWTLAYRDENGKILKTDTQPFALGFSIASQEHYKSNSYPNVRYILFDEYTTRKFYLPDEFIEFQNLLSTIIRLRDDVKIFMCGNTVNKYCPYHVEMGLTHIKSQQKGTIDLYTFGEGTKVAVEYSDFNGQKKKSNKYFCFDNPRLNMITSGGWEIDSYPHLPEKYLPKDIAYTFYIEFDGEKLRADVIYSQSGNTFIYITRKTTPFKKDNDRRIYTPIVNYQYNYYVNIMKPTDNIGRKIAKLITQKKIFYQDNECGEILQNYLKYCEKY